MFTTIKHYVSTVELHFILPTIPSVAINRVPIPPPEIEALRYCSNFKDSQLVMGQ